jgi:lactoylglutathione lyase
VDKQWPEDQYSMTMGDGARCEMFVYVDDVDAAVETLERRGSRVLVMPANMPWGEYVGVVADPDGNPVSLAAAQPA